jgi:hypothetical protein
MGICGRHAHFAAYADEGPVDAQLAWIGDRERTTISVGRSLNRNEERVAGWMVWIRDMRSLRDEVNMMWICGNQDGGVDEKRSEQSSQWWASFKEQHVKMGVSSRISR